MDKKTFLKTSNSTGWMRMVFALLARLLANDEIAEGVHAESEAGWNHHRRFATGHDGWAERARATGQVLPSIKIRAPPTPLEPRRTTRAGFRLRLVFHGLWQFRMIGEARGTHAHIYDFYRTRRVGAAVAPLVQTVKLPAKRARKRHVDFKGLARIADIQGKFQHHSRRAKPLGGQLNPGLAQQG